MGRSLDYLLSFQRFGIKLGLDNIIYLLDRIGNPHHKFSAIHVTGTNGKGSVVAFMHSALVSMGYKVGRFISPHLVDFSERILIDNVPITVGELEELVETIRPVIEEMQEDPHLEHPTFFEAVTAIAFLHFARRDVEFAVVEVGMGGRYDSTNVVMPCLTIITNVTLEHQDFLGDTIEKIAYEKAGIIKPGIDVVSAVRQPEVRRIIDTRAAECNARVYYFPEDYHCRVRPDVFPRQWIDFFGPWLEMRGIEINLPGIFQGQNAAIALMGLEALRQRGDIVVDEGALRKGLAATYWPARLEKVSDSPFMLLDGAHNPASMQSLVDAMEALFPGKKIILVVGMLGDKDVTSSLRILKRLSDTIIITQSTYERAMPAQKLADVAQTIFGNIQCEPSIAVALDQAIQQAAPDDIVLVAGSLFNVAEVKEFVGRLHTPEL